jgi:hypothetical protein
MRQRPDQTTKSKRLFASSRMRDKEKQGKMKEMPVGSE